MQVSELNGGHTRSFSAGPSFSGPRQLGARCGSPWILGGGGGVQTSRWLEGRACEPPLWPWWGRGCTCLPVTLTTGASPAGQGSGHRGEGRARPLFVCRHGLGSAARPGLSLPLYYFRTRCAWPSTRQAGTWRANSPRRHMDFKRGD